MVIHASCASVTGDGVSVHVEGRDKPGHDVLVTRVVGLAAAMGERLLTDAGERRADGQCLRIDLEVDDRRLA